MACLVPASLSARTIALDDVACVGGSDSVEAAFAIPPENLGCGADRKGLRGQFVRIRVDLAKAGVLPPGPLIWQTDPTSFDSMLVRLTYVDGSERLIDVDSQMATRNWDANGNFWVPIHQGVAALSTLDVVVERPQSLAIVDRMTLSTIDEAARSNDRRRLLYTLVCGLLIVPLLYDLLFYRVLRERFMVWHLGMTLGTLSYVLSNSGLIMLLLPDIDSHIRFSLIFVSTSLIMVGAAHFSILVLEDGKLHGRRARWLLWMAYLNLALSLLLLADLEWLRMRLVDLVLLSHLPIMLALGMLQLSALRLGSRVAKFLVLAFSGVILAGTFQVISSLGFDYASALQLDDLIYLALVALVLGTSAGVGDRFLVIKAERDRARVSAKRLGAMANTDGLTGLLNRRAFDQHRRLAVGQVLLLADLDRFKQVNDTYGHQQGDAVLCKAGRAIEDTVAGRASAQVFRLGGEEFAVLADISTAGDTLELCEAIRAAVANTRDGPEGLPPVTISIGACLGSGQLMHVAFSDADEALYRAKQGGRNRSELADN